MPKFMGYLKDQFSGEPDGAHVEGYSFLKLSFMCCVTNIFNNLAKSQFLTPWEYDTIGPFHCRHSELLSLCQ
jgi:hypothetical protein